MKKKLRKNSRVFFKIIGESLKQFFELNVPFLAAAVSFNLLLFLVPFSLFFLGMVGFLANHLPFFGFDLKEFLEFILGKYGKQAFSFMESVLKKRFVYGTYGMVWMLITFTFVLAPVETALRLIFEEKRSRHFLLQRLLNVAIFLGMMLVFVMFAFLSFTLQASLAFLSRFNLEIVQLFRNANRSGLPDFLMTLVFFFSVFAVSHASYRFLTVASVSRKQAFVASALTSFSAEAGRQVYLFLLKNVSFYDAIYGTLAFVFVGIGFAYFVTSAFLFGAVLIKVMKKMEVLL